MIKAVVIGLNGFGEYIAGIIPRCRNIELLGVHDVDPRAVAAVSSRRNVRPFYSLQEALDSECDAVILEVPNPIHEELAVAAARAKKHVFIDKPIANTVDAAEHIIRVCAGEGVLLQVGHSMRYAERFRNAKELIGQSAIGRIVMMEATYSSPRARSHQRENWRYSRTTCPGGPMLQLGIHAIDTMYYLTGCRPVAVKGLFADGFTATENEDVGMLVMELENGVLAYVGSSYTSPPIQRMVIYGEAGTIRLANNHSVLVSADGKETVLPALEHNDDGAYVRQFESFADRIVNLSRPEVDGETGLQHLKTILEAIHSRKPL